MKKFPYDLSKPFGRFFFSRHPSSQRQNGDYSEKIQNIVEFSSDRQCLKDGGITLLKDTDLDKFLNTDFKELTDAIGEPHADIGSGFYIPAYITNDAHLVVVELTNNMVFEFRIFDLLNKSVNGSIS